MTVKTKSGRLLTESDIQELADKAERGFDLSRWHPRRGRPSLTAPGEHSPRVSARVPEDLYRRATARAASEGKTMSEVVRSLVTGYASDKPTSRQR